MPEASVPQSVKAETEAAKTPKYGIWGRVIDVTPDLSEGVFTKLEQAAESGSEEKFGPTLHSYQGLQPVAGIRVSLQGNSIKKETLTDSEGKFEFKELPFGSYVVSVERSLQEAVPGQNRPAVVKKQVEFGSNQFSRQVRLTLNANAISIRGRVTDSEGQPIAGAKIMAEEEYFGEPSKRPDPVSAISSSDGAYELTGLQPPLVWPSVAGYLCGGDQSRAYDRQTPFFVKLHAEANGFRQDKETVPNVPLVTEKLAGYARRFIEIGNRLQTRISGSSELKEKEGVFLPASTGNTITGIDIVLKPAM